MEEFTIIVDRRRADSEDAAVRPAVDRRRQPSVDTKLNTDGYAIVSLSTTDALPCIEHVVDHQSAADDAEFDERELLRIVELKRRRKARIGPVVRTVAMVCAFSALVVLFVQMPAWKSPINRAQLVALPISDRIPEPPIEAQAASVTEAQAPPRPVRPPAIAPEPARPTASNASPSGRAGNLSANALDPTRPPEGSSPRSARGLEAGIETLASRVTRDVNTAGVEAKRQFDELQSKTMKNLGEMRRIWSNTAQVFSDKDVGATRGEAAARSRW